MQIADINWTRLSQQGTRANWLSALAKTQQTEQLVLMLNNAPQERRADALMAHLERLLKDTLNIPQVTSIQPDHGFFEMGMDSLMAVEFKNKIQQQLGGAISLSNTLIFDYATLAQLSDYLIANIEINAKAKANLPAKIDKLNLQPHVKPLNFRQMYLWHFSTKVGHTISFIIGLKEFSTEDIAEIL